MFAYTFLEWAHFHYFALTRNLLRLQGRPTWKNLLALAKFHSTSIESIRVQTNKNDTFKTHYWGFGVPFRWGHAWNFYHFFSPFPHRHERTQKARSKPIFHKSMALGQIKPVKKEIDLGVFQWAQAFTIRWNLFIIWWPVSGFTTHYKYDTSRK